FTASNSPRFLSHDTRGAGNFRFGGKRPIRCRCTGSHRRCWPPWPALGRRWPARLVATAAEDRLNIRRNPHIVWRASDVQTPLIDDKSLSPADRWLQSGSLLYFRDAILFACRSGKLQEALYSAGLEVYYWWCSLFRIRSRLIEFK